MPGGGAVCQAVERRGGRVLANYDHRKSGGVDGMDEQVAPPDPSKAGYFRQLSASLIIMMLLVSVSDYFMPGL